MQSSLARRAFVAGVIATLLAGCMASPPPSSSATSSPSVPSVASPPGATASLPSPDATHVPGALPAPTLTDPTEIGAALWDPVRAEEGVVSLVEQLGIDIFSAEGELVRDAAAQGPDGMWLFEAEVRGLIEMGMADAEAIAHGEVPFTLVDLYDGLAPVYPELTQDQLLQAYIDAYRAAPGDLVRESFAGHAFVPEAAFTRVHLWLFVLDGVLGRPQPATARTVAYTGGPRIAAAPVAVVALPSPSDALAELMAIELTALPVALAHLSMSAYTLPIEFTISKSTVHEGHGGPGQPATLLVHSSVVATPILSPITRLPILLPSGHSGFAGLPVIFESAKESTLNAHGTLSDHFGIPMVTDVLGDVRMTYTPRSEPANGRGDFEVDAVIINAVIDMRLFVAFMYAAGPAANLAMGARIMPIPLVIEWHEETATPSPGTPGAWTVSLSGPRPGAGTYSGVAESLCAHPDGYWTATARPEGSTVTMIDLQENASGAETLSVSTAPTNDFSGLWGFGSNSAGMTVTVDGSTATNPPLVTGHATYVDTEGRRYTADVSISCAQTF